MTLGAKFNDRNLNHLYIEIKLYYVEGQFRRLLCKILHYAGVKNKVSGREYTYKTIKKRIEEKHSERYKNDWIQVTKLKSYDKKSVDSTIRMLLRGLPTL